MSALSDSANNGRVIPLYEVLAAELGAFEPLTQEEQDYYDAHTQRLAATADARAKARDAVFASKIAQPEDKAAIDDLAEHAELRRPNPVFSLLHNRERSALCISGGGIRSATFALGVLQGLAQHSFAANQFQEPPRLLADFDFLSTVSGGGYIGSWFSSWVQRAGVANVLRQIAHHSANTNKIDPEPKPVRHLREYTNYLDPQLGLFSADTWTLAATVVRNILLNWLVLIPFLAAALLLPHLFNRVLRTPQPLGFNWLLWLGFGFGVLGVGSLLHGLPSFGKYACSQQDFVKWCLLPLIAAAICISIWWCWLSTEEASAVTLLDFLLFGAGLHTGGFLLAIVFSVFSKSENFFDIRKTAFTTKRVFAPNPLLLMKGAAGAIVTGALGAWLASLVANAIHPSDTDNTRNFACFAVPLVASMFTLTGVLAVGISSKITNDEDREWWSRAGGWLLAATIGWLAFFSLVLLLPPFVLSWGATSTVNMSGLAAALGWYVTQAGSQSKSRPEGRNSPANPPTVLEKLNNFLLPIAAVLFLIALCVVLTLTNAKIVEFLSRYKWIGEYGSLPLFLIEAGVATLASKWVNVNKFSLHAMYRMRLIRAYLGASNVRRAPNPFTGFDENDNIAMTDMSSEKPLHVLNLCLNLVGGSNLAWQERKAESFTVSRFHSGCHRVGYQPSATYGHGSKPGGISLGTAMAISGAAASPNMGYHSSPLTAIIMTLFNARLGWWLANPGEVGRPSWNHDGPDFAIKPFLDEALGRTNDQNRYVYLSDGGHFENLALYEMVLRRCKYIVVIDSGCDPEYTREDLGNAVRKVRIDLGISIEFADGIDIDPDLGEKGKRCALATIHYDCVDKDAEPGHLLYIKPVLKGNEPEDVKNYGSVNTAFPQEPTSDQWFTESQFESYRRLGLFTVEEMTGKHNEALSVPALFLRAKEYLLNDEDAIALAAGQV